MEKSHDYWRCLACGRTFDIPNKTEKPQRRAADKQRKVER